MSDTPRTSEEWKRLQRDEFGKYSEDVTYGELAHGMSKFAKNLERELAEAKEQRDALAEALEIIASGGRGHFQWSMTKAEWLARKALSAVKGGEG